ncbi:hypothetical protein FRB90_007671 [Tulasnella sp. 427]|nr:hypothetical protein FRB90_007671 [Tulasnella sp. 427]
MNDELEQVDRRSSMGSESDARYAGPSQPPQLQQAPPPPPTISNAMSVEDNKLVKQTYSVYTKLPGDSENRALRKWHLTAYYTPHAVQSGQLKDITQIPELANLQIPPNRFKAARIGKRGGTTGSENQVPMAGGGPGSTTTTSMYASVTPGGDYIAYGDPHHSHHPHHGHLMGVGAATLEPSRYPPVVRHAPGGSSSGGSSVASSPLHRHHGEVSPTTSARGHHAHLSWPTANGASSPLLPPASALGVGHHTPPIPGYAGPTAGGYHPQLYPPSQQPPQYPHHPPSGVAYPPPSSGPYPPPPSSQPQYQSYHQPQYSPGPSYPPPPRTSSPLVMSSSPRARISSLPSISTSVSQAQFGHNLPPLPARYPTAYEAQVPQYPPPAKPYDELPHSPAESVHSDFGGAKDVEMQDASGPSGLTTIVENRALPPLDITVSFQARTAEDERTLWALNKGFGKDMK